MKYIIIVLAIFISCGSPFRKLMHGGMVVQKNFKETISFDFTKGLPLIEVEIQGGKYRFLLDTGAPNVISKELSENIKFTEGVTQNIGDSQGSKNEQLSVLIEKITIGNIDFINTGAIIIDYSGIFELNCFGIDGIIGANLMSKLIWEIDYRNSLISFSDLKSSFEIPDDAFLIPFVPHSNQRTPYVEIKADQMVFKKVTFDTGATGAISLSRNKEVSKIELLKGFEIHGSLSVGIYGRGEVTASKYGVVEKLNIGTLALKNQVLVFESQGTMIMGNKFLKEYRVVIDWGSETIYLIKEDGYDKRGYESFGFIPKKMDDKLQVIGLIKESFAASEGIDLNTQILEIEGVDYRKVSDSLGCELVTSDKIQKLDSIQVTFLYHGMEKIVSIPKMDFIRAKQN